MMSHRSIAAIPPCALVVSPHNNPTLTHAPRTPLTNMASFAAPLSHARALVSRALSCGSRGYHHHHRTSVRASPTNLHYPLHYNHNNDKFQQKKVAGSGHQKVLVAPARLSSPAARTAAVVARAAADDAAGEGGKPRQQPYDAAALLNKSGAFRSKPPKNNDTKSLTTTAQSKTKYEMTFFSLSLPSRLLPCRLSYLSLTFSPLSSPPPHSPSPSPSPPLSNFFPPPTQRNTPLKLY